MKYLFSVAIMFLPLLCLAQDTARMETDRPDQTESPYITKRGYLQGELGLNVERNQGLTTIVHPTALWKYGVSKRFELRLITEVHTEETPFVIPSGSDVHTGLSPVTVGGKLALWEEKGLLPKTAFIGHVTFPKLASKYFQASQVAPEFRLGMQNTLTEKISLGYNIGAEWDGESGIPSWIYTIGPGFNVGQNGYAYVELYGDFHKDGPPEHNVDGGFAYYLNDNMKLDISSGISLTTERQFYVAVGFSFRLKAF